MFFLAANYGGIFISSKEQLFGTASEPQIGLSFLESQRPQATSFTAKAHVSQEREGNAATPWELGLSLEQTIDFPLKIPSGKLTVCYGKSPCYSWENPLFLWSFSIASC